MDGTTFWILGESRGKATRLHCCAKLRIWQVLHQERDPRRVRWTWPFCCALQETAPWQRRSVVVCSYELFFEELRTLFLRTLCFRIFFFRTFFWSFVRACRAITFVLAFFPRFKIVRGSLTLNRTYRFVCAGQAKLFHTTEWLSFRNHSSEPKRFWKAPC